MKIIDFLLKNLTGWKEKLSNDEWFFDNLREYIVQHYSYSDMYSSLNDMVELLISPAYSDLFSELLDTYVYIAHEINTTEPPSLLYQNIGELTEIAKSKGTYEAERIEDLKLFFHI